MAQLCKKYFPELFYVHSTVEATIEKRVRIPYENGPVTRGATHAGVNLEGSSLRLVSDHFNGDEKMLLSLYQTSARNYTVSEDPDATGQFHYGVHPDDKSTVEPTQALPMGVPKAFIDLLNLNGYMLPSDAPKFVPNS